MLSLSSPSICGANNCCNQQLTKYKNKKGQQSTQTGTGWRRRTKERRTTLCANEQLDFILSLGINCSFPASATGRRQRTGQVEEPGPTRPVHGGTGTECEWKWSWGRRHGTCTMPAGCGKVCAICLSLCDSLRKWPIGVNGVAASGEGRRRRRRQTRELIFTLLDNVSTFRNCTLAH